jgi:selenide,water dikinase
VTLPQDCADWKRHLLTDPQTSGGLLVATAADSADALVRMIVAEGYPSARIIGRIETGAAAVSVSNA